MLLTLGIILLICALFLIVAILMQQGKGKSLGSAISGGNSDTYFGKTKDNKKLSTVTTIVAIVFVVLVLVVYIVQDSVSAPSFGDAVTGGEHDHASDTVDTTADTTADITDAVTAEATSEETTPAA